ncbi:MAG: RloB family protein [Pirellulaceae bacterium]
MGKRNRSRRPARREPHVDPLPVILVVCEGGTEEEYIEAFAAFQKNPRVRVNPVGHAGVPLSVVREAKRLKHANQESAVREKDDNLRYDAVWAVFDIDEHPNIPEARVMARDNEIEVAVSNPCVELWLYLHFKDQPGMQHRRELQSLLKKIVPGYDKHINFALFATGYVDAHRRAKTLDKLADSDSDSGRNPTTGFWRLTESISP